MIASLLPRGALAAIVLTAAAPALAQAPPPASPACQRLEAQLTALDRGNSDPARAQQIPSAEDAVNRQQVEVDRLVSQSRRMGCESSGFFSIFSNPPPACGPLVRQIGQRRSQLERMQNDLERLSGGTTERAAQRQSLLIAARNTARRRSPASVPGSSTTCSATTTATSIRRGPWAAPSAPFACAPATAFISRFPTPPRPTASATTSRPASACVRRRRHSF